MKAKSVSVESIDVLFLKWNSYLNASGLYRQMIREKMRDQQVDPPYLRQLVEQALDQGYEFDDLVDRTDRVEDLERLLEENVTDTPSD